eukprot:TRINITY_DN5310_c1_g1_i1.p4 TRINITY_DN5310_c1_g1~~TRINITY_DN5310_c1_g1_i1.p4  ORF type:complete len:197 (+),score=1.93 TRINITY_DN5310_c1_g1_i1:259-849(+)
MLFNTLLPNLTITTILLNLEKNFSIRSMLQPKNLAESDFCNVQNFRIPRLYIITKFYCTYFLFSHNIQTLAEKFLKIPTKCNFWGCLERKSTVVTLKLTKVKRLFRMLYFFKHFFGATSMRMTQKICTIRCKIYSNLVVLSLFSVVVPRTQYFFFRSHILSFDRGGNIFFRHFCEAQNLFDNFENSIRELPSLVHF